MRVGTPYHPRMFRARAAGLCLLLAGCASPTLAPYADAGADAAAARDLARPDDLATASVTFTSNGSSTLTASPGTPITFVWSSVGVASMTSTVSITDGSDPCGNHDGPWVVSTTSGTTTATLLACQASHVYQLTLTGTTAAAGQVQATDVLTVP